MASIIEKAKYLFKQIVNDFGSDPYHLLSHVSEAVKWAVFMLKKYPQADREVVLLAVCLHDIGHYMNPAEVDHAVLGEERVKIFLEKENYSKGKTKKVLHCIRAHRCKDVLPKTLEAKIIAFIDSASHFTDFVYLDMAKENKSNKDKFKAFGKIDRDYRDLSFFPEIKEQLTDLYNAWKILLKAFNNFDLECKL